jgi:hypothetical protein
MRLRLNRVVVPIKNVVFMLLNIDLKNLIYFPPYYCACQLTYFVSCKVCGIIPINVISLILLILYNSKCSNVIDETLLLVFFLSLASRT